MSAEPETPPDIHSVLAEYTEAQSTSRVKEILRDIDAKHLADALADERGELEVEVLVDFYRKARGEFAEAKEAEDAAWEKFQTAKRDRDQAKK